MKPADYPIEILELADLTLKRVSIRMIRAHKTLRVQPDAEARFRRDMKAAWPTFRQDWWHAWETWNDPGTRAKVDADWRKFRPTGFDVDDFLPALAWLRGVAHDDWQFLKWDAFGYAASDMAVAAKCTEAEAKRRTAASYLGVWHEAIRTTGATHPVLQRYRDQVSVRGGLRDRGQLGSFADLGVERPAGALAGDVAELRLREALRDTVAVL
jgi:hypothetical protein